MYEKSENINRTERKYLYEMIENEVNQEILKPDLREIYLCELYMDMTTIKENLIRIKRLHKKHLEQETRDYMKPLKAEKVKISKKHIEEVTEILNLIVPKIEELEKNGRIDILNREA